jgi:cysteine desulfurase/selenocysteine lyase
MAALATKLDPSSIKTRFPALAQDVHGHPLVYLDNAATTQKPLSVLEAVDHYYRHDNANVHRGLHELSVRATNAYEGARARVADWINASTASEVVFTSGTTEGINLVAQTWGRANVFEGDEIVLTTMEHHSNLVPWQILAQEKGAKLRFFDVTEQGELDLSGLESLITSRTRIVAVGHVSNSLGTINPIEEIGRAAHRVGAVLVVDGAQGAPHLRIDVQSLGCDFYALSGHKMCAPTGIGALWGRTELLEAMPPYQGGGEMIHVVELERSTWAKVPHKFEAGTPNIGGAVGLHAAIDFLVSIGQEAVLAHEREVVGYALERLAPIPGIRLFGPDDPTRRSGVVSFDLDGVHPHDVATVLDSKGIAIRAGHHCTQPLMRRLGVAATSRASFYLYNSTEDVDRLYEGLATVRTIFGSA